MKKRFLTTTEINELASEAVRNYEFSCEWRNTAEAISDYAFDYWEIGVTKAQIATVICVAKTKWMALSLEAKTN